MPAYAIVHSDDQVIVVIKDAGLLTTPAHGEPCLVDMLDARFVGRTRVAVVHRLDKLTSGLLVFARNPVVAAHLAKQFAAHKVEREYVAMVEGHLKDAGGSIAAPLLGKRAVTHYRTLTQGPRSTTVAVRLETGRRNQIRAHFSLLGHPVLGDSRFGATSDLGWPRDRIALHARVLGFIHPKTKVTARFECELPAEFLQLY